MDQVDANVDSFVIRLWHHPADGRLLRAEISHVQTGAVAIGRNVPMTWLIETLAQLRTARLSPHPADSAGSNPSEPD